MASAAGGRPSAGRPGDLRAPHSEADEWEETLTRLGYVFCRPCGEHHRGSECWIDENGRSALDIALDADRFGS